jgi:hypothetical protein
MLAVLSVSLKFLSGEPLAEIDAGYDAPNVSLVKAVGTRVFQVSTISVVNPIATGHSL